MSLQKIIQFIAASAMMTSFSAMSVEITPLIGQAFSSDLQDTSNNDLSLDSGSSVSLAVSWPSGPNGQGQFILTSTSHEFDNDLGQTRDIDFLYGHFNGVLFMRQQHYITTISIGLGLSLADVEGGGDEIFPSFTAALGTRYEIDKHFSVITELRSYATITDEDSDIFCQADTCFAQFDSAIFFDNTFSIGVAYQF